MAILVRILGEFFYSPVKTKIRQNMAKIRQKSPKITANNLDKLPQSKNVSCFCLDMAQ
jgi:hypothetical protein